MAIIKKVAVIPLIVFVTVLWAYIYWSLNTLNNENLWIKDWYFKHKYSENKADSNENWYDDLMKIANNLYSKDSEVHFYYKMSTSINKEEIENKIINDNNKELFKKAEENWHHPKYLKWYVIWISNELDSKVAKNVSLSNVRKITDFITKKESEENRKTLLQNIEKKMDRIVKINNIKFNRLKNKDFILEETIKSKDLNPDTIYFKEKSKEIENIEKYGLAIKQYSILLAKNKNIGRSIDVLIQYNEFLDLIRRKSVINLKDSIEIYKLQINNLDNIEYILNKYPVRIKETIKIKNSLKSAEWELIINSIKKERNDDISSLESSTSKPKILFNESETKALINKIYYEAIEKRNFNKIYNQWNSIFNYFWRKWMHTWLWERIIWNIEEAFQIEEKLIEKRKKLYERVR